MFDHAPTHTGVGPVVAAAAAGPPPPEVPGYAVGELVGRGGMGRVYRARHTTLGRTVAIKVIAHEPNDKLLARFREEARAVARLQHPNIVQLYECGTADGRPFTAQEFVDGGSLADKFAGKPQDPAAAATLVEIVARAIHFSHEHGILHRDLKPGNVLLTADGTPKVTDFGLAKELAATPDSSAAGLTHTGEIVGTPGYMPPEQASGVVSGLGPAADVYSLGAILYEALTGRPPFHAADPLQTLLLVLSTDPVPPRALVPKLPRDLETICLKCLEKTPRKRYDTAAALADDLRRFLTGEPILARPVGTVERVRKWAARKPGQAALVGVSALLAVGVVAAAVWLGFNSARLAKLNADLETTKTSLEATNADLLAAKTESDRSYALATDTVDRIVADLSVRLNGVPTAEPLMLDVIGRSGDLYRQLRELRPGDRGAASRYVTAMNMRLAFETGYGHGEAAAKTRATLQQFLSAELVKWPDDFDLRAAEARLAYDAVLASRRADASAARGEYVRLAEAFAARFPLSAQARKFTVQKHWQRAAEAAANEDADARIAALKEAVAEARGFATTPDGRVLSFVYLGGSLMQLAVAQAVAGRKTDADATYAEAEDLYAAGSPDTQDAAHRRAQLAAAKVGRAGIAFDLKRLGTAYALYAEAEPVLRELVKDFPLTQEYRITLADCLSNEGLLLRHDDPARCLALAAEAVEHMDRLVKQVPAQADYKVMRDNYAAMHKNLTEQLKPTPDGKDK